MSRPALRALALAAALLAAACDSGPEGPGTLAATVVSPQALGGVVLEFTGQGIEGFEPAGGTQVWDAPLAPATGSTLPRHRVVLIGPGGSELRFGIRVADRAAPRPTVVALVATSPANLPIVPGGLQIRIED